MTYLGSYLVVATVVAIGILVFVAARVTNRLLAPSVRSDAKEATYECGLDPLDTDWAQGSVRYYVYAYLYVVFAIDAVYLFPWALVFAQQRFGGATVVEMGLFVGLLSVGIAYAWRRGAMRWDRT